MDKKKKKLKQQWKPPNSPLANQLRLVRARVPFVGSTGRELTFKKDALLTVLKSFDQSPAGEQWFLGKDSYGNVGIFPACAVREVRDSHTEPKSSRISKKPSASELALLSKKIVAAQLESSSSSGNTALSAPPTPNKHMSGPQANRKSRPSTRKTRSGSTGSNGSLSHEMLVGSFGDYSSGSTTPSSSYSSPRGELFDEPKIIDISPTSVSRLLARMKFSLWADTSESRVALYESFKDHSTVTVFQSTLEEVNLDQYDCIILPCESSLGPEWPPWGLANRLATKLGGEELHEMLKEYIRSEFLGELQIAQAQLVTFNKKSIIIVALGRNSASLFHQDYTYSAMRSVLLRLIRHNRLAFSNPHVRHELEIHSISNILLPCFPSIGPLVSKDPHWGASQVAWQISLAYRSLSHPPSTIVPETLRQKEENLYCGKPRVNTDAYTTIMELLETGGIEERGVSDSSEVDVLIDMVRKGNGNLHVQAAQAIAHLITSEQDKTLSSIRDRVFKNCSRQLLALIVKDRVRVHTKVKLEDIQLETRRGVGLGATSTIKIGTWRGGIVAVKKFRAPIDVDAVRREVGLMSLLSHPNLLACLGACLDPNEPFLLSNFYRRGDLYKVLHKTRIELSLAQRLKFMMDTANGMEYLHANNIIHRDMKSLNLLVTDDWLIKICDYGASRVVDLEKKMTVSVGTVAWVAPEVLAGEKYTEKADVYSFGVVLFEIVTREEPFANYRPFTIPLAVCKGTRPTIPKTILSSTPKSWIKLLQQCWHQRPNKRPSFKKIHSLLEEASMTL